MQAIGHQLQCVLHGAVGGTKTGLVAIKAEHDVPDLSEQGAQAVLIRCGAKGGHRKVDVVLCQRNDIHVAFHHQQLIQLADGLFGFVQAVNLAALVKYI